MEYSELKKRHFGDNDTDKKLTDEEIIMRLERCVSRGNRNYDTDIVLDLIRRQKAEIDSAKAKIEICAEVIKRQDAEIKRLKDCPKCVYEYDGEVIEYCVQGPCPNFKTVEQIKTEAYKEFAEKLEEKLCDCRTVSDGEYCGFDCGDTHECIDNLLKEMVGEENDRQSRSRKSVGK